jgi:tetrapyrrole methylase family protein / MazG family protein
MTLSLADLGSALAALEQSELEAGSGELPSIQILSAKTLAGQHYPQIDPAQPVLLVGLDGLALVYAVVRSLLAVYPSDHPVQLLGDKVTRRLSLAQLGPPSSAALGGAEPYSFAASDGFTVAALYLPALSKPSAYTALQEIVARLRAPDGCPWDRDLTWDKLRPSLLEETYELLAALDARDPARVVEEQGDLLLQIALQTQIAIEEGLYTSPDVIAAIVDKLVRRHPHVFGDLKVSGTDEVLANWEAIKRSERKNSTQKRSPLAGIPANLPALSQADAYLDRMSRLQTQETPEAPWAELSALPAGAGIPPEIVGRALFGLVAWAHARGVDAESALRAENARYAALVTDDHPGGDQ